MSPHLDDHRYGASFDVTLYCSAALENGKTAGEGAQFMPLVAQAIEAYIGAGLGREMPAAANNTFRALGTVNENGEPNILGSPGLLRAIFDGPHIARVHAAGHGAGQILARWSELDDAASARSIEETAAQVHHLGNDYTFMTHGQVDDDGVFVLADFDKELEKEWKRRKPGRSTVVPSILQAEEIYRARVQAAVQHGAERFEKAVLKYTEATQSAARTLIDNLGPAAGITMADALRGRFNGLEGLFNEQSAGLAEELHAAESSALAALEDLERAVSEGGVMRGYKKELRAYIERVTNAFKLRYAFELIERALAALIGGHAPVQQLFLASTEMQRAMRAVAAALLSGARAVEDRRLTPVQELVERPVLRRDDLRALYMSVVGAGWDEIPPELEQRLRHELAPLSGWLNASEGHMRSSTLTAALPAFDAITDMSADDAFRWRAERTGRLPELVLRDLIDMAPIMCRYDRARLPDAGTLYERSFTMIGVPDRDSSFFAGTQQATLVTTGDSTQVVVLQLKLGFPPSAIWGFDRHLRAYEEVRRAGLVAQDIYPGFPHELKRAWNPSSNGTMPDRRTRRSKSKGRR